ncbi:MAG: phospholipid carrier-dependent glycosyltransferase [Candidatus Schekmanbacteria bacterium]|nr:phospholipid carrier-dependent glycosyltransferase [Candidatus Schekmanbacteria bacterium]
MPCQNKQKIVSILAGLVLLPFLCFIFLSDLDDLGNYQGDESTWITVSERLFRLYALERNFSDPDWYKEFNTFGSRQPQIGKYLIGLGAVTTDFRGDPREYLWQWSKSREWNMGHTVPPAKVVARARFPVAIMGVIACLSFYWLVTLVTNQWCGLLALANLLGARLLLDLSRRAMIDTPAFTFGLLTLIGMVYLLRSLRDNHTGSAVYCAILTGLAAGAAVGTKLNALLILLVCIISIAGEALLSIYSSRIKAYAAFLCMFIVLGVAGMVFYLSNPFLYHAPLAGFKHMLEMNDIVFDIPYQSLSTLPERISALWKNTGVFAPFANIGLPVDRVILLLGIVAFCIMSFRQGYKRLRYCGLDLILLWIVISYAGIILWLPHDWPRYYLPLQPCNAFLQAYGICWVVSGLRNLVRS